MLSKWSTRKITIFLFLNEFQLLDSLLLPILHSWQGPDLIDQVDPSAQQRIEHKETRQTFVECLNVFAGDNFYYLFEISLCYGLF